MSAPVYLPKEIEELKKIYKPYLVKGELKNPTPEAVEAFEKVMDWYGDFSEGSQ